LAGRKTSSSVLSSPAPSVSSEFVSESTYSSSSPSASPSSAYLLPVVPFTVEIPEAPPSGTPLPTFLNDPSLLNPLSGLPAGSLDYLKLDDAPIAQQKHKTALPARGFTDDLCYGTGCTYLTALTLGGAMGFAEGLRQVPPYAPTKLKINAILNGVTRRGPFLGNSAGVIALLYNCMGGSSFTKTMLMRLRCQLLSWLCRCTHASCKLFVHPAVFQCEIS
jgi:inner membrane translocase subunit Tim23